jgi:uncharacterized membrane protein required for colicin V production
MANFFDLFAVIVTIGLGILGFREGIVKGAIKLVGFILLLVALSIWADDISTFARSFDVIPPQVAGLLAFVILLIGGSLALNLIASALAGLIAMTPAHFVDAGLGCAFGMIKALFLAGLVALALSCAQSGTFFGGQYRTSHLAPGLRQFASVAVPFLKSAATSLFNRLDPVMPGNGDKEEPQHAPSEPLI